MTRIIFDRSQYECHDGGPCQAQDRSQCDEACKRLCDEPSRDIEDDEGPTVRIDAFHNGRF